MAYEDFNEFENRVTPRYIKFLTQRKKGDLTMDYHGFQMFRADPSRHEETELCDAWLKWADEYIEEYFKKNRFEISLRQMVEKSLEQKKREVISLERQVSNLEMELARRD